MPTVSRKDIVNASADEVWRTLREFKHVESFLPVVASSTVEGSGVGCIRTCNLRDGVFPGITDAKTVERLESLDEQTRTLRYSLISGPLPVESYVATMKVRDLGDSRCEVEFSGSFEPKGVPQTELAKMIEQVYSMGLDGLKKLHSA